MFTSLNGAWSVSFSRQVIQALHSGFPPCSFLQLKPFASFRLSAASIAQRKHFPINLPPLVRAFMFPQSIIVLCCFLLVDTLLVIASVPLFCVAACIGLTLFHLVTIVPYAAAFLGWPLIFFYCFR